MQVDNPESVQLFREVRKGRNRVRVDIELRGLPGEMRGSNRRTNGKLRRDWSSRKPFAPCSSTPFETRCPGVLGTAVLLDDARSSSLSSARRVTIGCDPEAVNTSPSAALADGATGSSPP